MLLTKSLRKLLGVVLVVLAVGCVPVPGTPTPVPSVPSLPPPTPTTPSLQNTSVAIVKSIISQSLSVDTAGLYGLAFSPDGNTLVSASNANGLTIALWNIATGQIIDSDRDLSHYDDGMALSPDGKTLAYGKCGEYDPSHCAQYEIILWDVATRQPIGQPPIFHVGALAPLELLFSPDGKTLAAMSSGTTGSGIIQLFDVTTRQPIDSPLGGEESFASMAFSPDGKFMALGNTVGVIDLWGVQAHQVLSLLVGEKGFVTSVAFSPDGKTLASRILIPSTDHPPRGEIVLWDLDKAQLIGQPLIVHTATGGEVGLTSMAFSPDGKTLASIDDNGAITLWDATTRQPIGQSFVGQTATGGVGVTTSMAFSPDGKTLASGTEDGTITLWDLATGSHSP